MQLFLFAACYRPCGKWPYLHIGQNDLSLFEKEPSAFDQGYTSLIKHIRNVCKHCSLAIITLRNADNDPLIEQLNKHLAVIAQNEGCELCDIAKQQAWNPRQTKEVVSFLYSMGFVRPLNNKRPVQDVARILFCYNLIWEPRRFCQATCQQCVIPIPAKKNQTFLALLLVEC